MRCSVCHLLDFGCDTFQCGKFTVCHLFGFREEFLMR